ncbi:hypothetical protein DFH09DRAFT_1320105 [Mycena vulgaris]|nr:hypothetical protein DFH09DRAFT_1320105 [Mycena vulgaris]
MSPYRLPSLSCSPSDCDAVAADQAMNGSSPATAAEHHSDQDAPEAVSLTHLLGISASNTILTVKRHLCVGFVDAETLIAPTQLVDEVRAGHAREVDLRSASSYYYRSQMVRVYTIVIFDFFFRD